MSHAEDWEKARITMEMEIRTRDNAGKSLRILLANGDAAAIDRAACGRSTTNSKQNSEGIKSSTTLVNDEPDGRTCSPRQRPRARSYSASRGR